MKLVSGGSLEEPSCPGCAVQPSSPLPQPRHPQGQRAALPHNVPECGLWYCYQYCYSYLKAIPLEIIPLHFPVRRWRQRDVSDEEIEHGMVGPPHGTEKNFKESEKEGTLEII